MRWLVLVAALAACSHKVPSGAATDAPTGAADAPKGDASSSNGSVGTPCTNDNDCPIDVFGVPDGLCIHQAPFTNGYCSARIGECPAPGGGGQPCPPGSACIHPGIQQTGGADFCLKQCASGSDCRTADAYTCCPAVAGQMQSVCYPLALCSF